MSELANLKDQAAIFGKSVAFEKFKRSNKFLMRKLDYEKDITTTYMAGYVTMCQSILHTHKHTPFESVEEVLGSVHLHLMESWNIVSDSENIYRHLKLEEIIEYGDGDISCVFRGEKK
jgi:hypothetical protein